VRLDFAHGQLSVPLSGQVAAGASASYVLNVLGGQTILARLNDNPPGNLAIAVLDATSQTLNSGRAPTELSTRAPADGDYIITLSNNAASPVSFSLVVFVTPIPQPGFATRITFAAGATSATVSGDMLFGGDGDFWIIYGLAGQTLNLSLSASQAGQVMIYVFDAAGDLVALGSDLESISAPLVADGDVTIAVTSDPAAGPVTYYMTVEIP
jgi:hypothetical protein